MCEREREREREWPQLLWARQLLPSPRSVHLVEVLGFKSNLSLTPILSPLQGKLYFQILEIYMFVFIVISIVWPLGGGFKNPGEKLNGIL